MAEEPPEPPQGTFGGGEADLDVRVEIGNLVEQRGVIRQAHDTDLPLLFHALLR